MFRRQDVGAASDPFYTELVAAAAARGVSEDLLAFLADHAPLALIATLKHVRRLSGAERTQVREAVRRWIRVSGAHFVGAFGAAHLVEELLLEADDEVALEVADLLPQSHWLDLARMANGDMAAALRSFNPSVNGGDGAGVQHPVRERALARAAMRFPAELRRMILSVLNTGDSDIEDLTAAMVMAGFLGEPAWGEPVLEALRRAAEPESLLPHALWAVCRCARDPGSAELVRPLLDVWARVSEEPKDQLGDGPRFRIADHMKYAFSHGITEFAVAEFVAAAGGVLGREIRYVLSTVDEPAAIEMITRAAADSREEAAATGGFSTWAISVRDTWAAGWPYRRRLSAVSHARLEALWRNGAESIWVRKQAFEVWARSADAPPLAVMQEVTADDPLYETVLWWRMLRGDQTVTDAILPHFEAKPHWLHYAGRIWNTRTRNVVDAQLSVAAADLPRDFTGYGDSALATVLREIPVEHAAELIERHWAGLRYGALYVQAALFVSTPWCREAAYAAIREAGTGGKLLEHLVSHLGTREEGREYSVGMAQLESITPILPRLDAFQLGQLVGLAERVGARQWATENVRPLLPAEERIRYPLADDDFVAALAREVEDPRWGLRYVAHWVQDQAERGRRSEAVAAARRYYLNEPTEFRFDVLARALAVAGTRADLQDLYLLAGAADADPDLVRGVELSIRRRTLE
jgi:hypothetical protein